MPEPTVTPYKHFIPTPTPTPYVSVTPTPSDYTPTGVTIVDSDGATSLMLIAAIAVGFVACALLRITRRR